MLEADTPLPDYTNSSLVAIMRAMTLSLPAALEAMLFASGEPLSHTQLAELLGTDEAMIKAAIDDLQAQLSDRGLALVENGSQVELRTTPAASELVRQLREREFSRDLGKASLETLAIILYRPEGATRSEIDWVRGVNSATAVRTLLMRGLIERGEDVTDRRRARYHATLDALAHLGITKREDLPRYAELSAAIREREVLAEVEAET